MTDASKTNPAREGQSDPTRGDGRPGAKKLTAAALRALAEAAARRQKSDAPPAPEINGRGGLDPVRYDDWEVKGLATDF